ncbi:MAG: transglycosylase domain-containing protein [Clostridia bacterium]|nr:transglycosylase domain-containing protein [Clostridia bacterium]
MSDNEDLFSYSAPDDGSGDDSLDLNSFSTNATDLARKKRARKANGKKRIITIVLTVFLVGVITVSIAIGAFLLYAFTVVDGNMEGALDDLDLKYTTIIYYKDSNGEWAEYQRLHGEFNRIWVDYDRNAAQSGDENYTGIPERLVNAFVAIEDKRFREHDGVDWRRTVSAFLNLLRGSKEYGGSTITQQLVKNITSDDDKTVSRKLQEIMRARYLEGHYSKDTILECYLNTVYLGHSVYGVGVAANYYFGKDVKDLDIAECAALAAITKNPSSYTPENDSEKSKTRRITTLNEMLEQGYINNEEYDAAKAELEQLKVVSSLEAVRETSVNNYYVDALIVQVTKDLAKKYNMDMSEAAKNFYEGGYKIYSTVNPTVQAAVDKVYGDAGTYGTINKKTGAQIQGAITVMDYEGHVVGLAGGIGEKTVNLGISGFNRATDAQRQPGSTIKPLAVYAPAIESGLINYSTVLEDKKLEYKIGGKVWSPKNYGNADYGFQTVEYALQESINRIPVQLVEKLTPQVCFDFLTNKLGITTLDPQSDIAYAPMALGGTTTGLSTLQSAAAYAIFGNGGYYYEPTFYYSVRDQKDNEILKYNTRPTVAISEGTAVIMNKLLQNVVENGTGKLVKGAVPGMKLFGKTGTASDANDIWFSGGSPYYVASAWCGYDVLTGLTDTGLAKTMWKNVMSAAHSGLPVKEFKESDYVERRYYCKETGLLATEACTDVRIGWYKKRDLPGVCATHEGTILDSPDVAEKKES